MLERTQATIYEGSNFRDVLFSKKRIYVYNYAG